MNITWVKVFRIWRLTFHSLRILNEADSYGFFGLISVYLKTTDHLNLEVLIFVGILQVLRFDFQKFRILEILNFHSWYDDKTSLRPPHT